MKSSRKLFLALPALVGLVILTGWLRGWFSGEPHYRGRTVTQWLDHMALFDGPREMDRLQTNDYTLPGTPEAVANDPSLRALLALGPAAVPTLEKRLMEPPQWPPGSSVDRMGEWMSWKLGQLRGSRPAAARPAPMRYGSFQRARNMAAGLTMLALGTNGHAGVVRLLEIDAAAPPDAYGYRNSTLFDPFQTAASGLPDRHAEIIAGLMAALDHPNARCRSMAASLLGTTLRSDAPVWKDKLLKLAREDPDAGVRLNALWSLAIGAAGDDETIRLCEETLRDPKMPSISRTRAAYGLGHAGAKAAKFLPLLREILGGSKNGDLQRAAREAIQSIEKAGVPEAASVPK